MAEEKKQRKRIKATSKLSFEIDEQERQAKKKININFIIPNFQILVVGGQEDEPDDEESCEAGSSGFSTNFEFFLNFICRTRWPAGGQ